jgi:hypothetical protein
MNISLHSPSQTHLINHFITKINAQGGEIEREREIEGGGGEYGRC